MSETTTRPPAPAASARDALIDQLSAPVAKSVSKLRLIAGGVALAAFILAAFVPISSGAIAPGQVAPDISRQIVQHPTGGVVSEILVREGQRVEAGALVLRLNAVEESADANMVEFEIVSLQSEAAVRMAELTGASDVTFPEHLLARRGEPLVGEILDAQHAAFVARRDQAALQRRQIASQRQQIRAQLAAASAQETAATEQLNRVNAELEGYYTLLERGFIARTRVLAAERFQAELTGQVGTYQAEQNRLRAQDRELAARDLQINVNTRAEAAEALREARNRLAVATPQQTAADERVNRAEVRAPVTGTIIDLRANTVGGVVGPGEPMMQIVPEAGRLIVFARVSPQDADDVRNGAKAVMRFSAVSGRSDIRLRGQVETISADALVDQRTGGAYFEARVAIPPEEARRLPPSAYTPGFPAEVLIETGSRTVLSYLFAPLEGGAFRAMREP